MAEHEHRCRQRDLGAPVGHAADGEFQVAVTPTATNAVPGWSYTRLRIATLAPGGHVDLASGDRGDPRRCRSRAAFRVEVIEADGTAHDVTLAGRASVFAGPTDFVYAGRGATLRVTLAGPDAGRFALCGAPAAKAAEPRRFRHLAAAEVPVELRGAGQASRQVNNFCLPDALEADSLIVCEVLTPGGNWSLVPAAQARRGRAGERDRARGDLLLRGRSTDPRGTDPVGYQRVYGTSSARPIDVLAEVRTGDVVLVPHGWHGPSIAAPATTSTTSTSWPAPAPNGPG